MIDTSAHTGAVSLEYVRQDGTVGKIQKAVKGSVYTSSRTKSKFHYRVKEKKVALVQNRDTQEYRSLKINRIIRCNGKKINHEW